MSQNPPQKTHQKQAIGRLGLGVVSLALVAGCTAPGTGGAEESAAPPSASPSAETGATGTTEETQPASTHAIGETVTMGELEHTLHGVRFSQGDEYSAPEAGTRWLVADIEVTNNSDASEAISSVMMWTLNDPDHRSVDMTYTGDERGSLDGELGPGRSMRGEIAYAVSADQTSWELIFAPEFSGSDRPSTRFPRPSPRGLRPSPGRRPASPPRRPCPERSRTRTSPTTRPTRPGRTACRTTTPSASTMNLRPQVGYRSVRASRTAPSTASPASTSGARSTRPRSGR